ncbi:hypothetical protein PSEUDO9AG_50432 [Pseudomonas sp. 9Ag]|nr:hypothetical protein PSEUDO9AG_50432 [Pseudomonas sp. 9Ag]
MFSPGRLQYCLSYRIRTQFEPGLISSPEARAP